MEEIERVRREEVLNDIFYWSEEQAERITKNKEMKIETNKLCVKISKEKKTEHKI